MAERLGIHHNAVVGKLLRLWICADQQTCDGNANGNALGVTRTFIDRCTCVTGFTEAMRQAGWSRTGHSIQVANARSFFDNSLNVSSASADRPPFPLPIKRLGVGRAYSELGRVKRSNPTYHSDQAGPGRQWFGGARFWIVWPVFAAAELRFQGSRLPAEGFRLWAVDSAVNFPRWPPGCLRWWYSSISPRSGLAWSIQSRKILGYCPVVLAKSAGRSARKNGPVISRA